MRKEKERLSGKMKDKGGGGGGDMKLRSEKNTGVTIDQDCVMKD